MKRLLETLDDFAERVRWIPRLVILISVAIFAGYAVSRAPPYALLWYHADPVHAGEHVLFRSRVWRDAKRDCSVQYSRFLKFSDGSEISGPVTIASDAMIDELDREHPGEAFVRVFIPQGIPSGPASMRTVLHYRCNLTQYILPPIEVTVMRNFYVLP